MPHTAFQLTAGAIIAATLSLTASISSAGELSAQAQQYQTLCQQAKGYFQYGTVNSPPNSDYSKVVNYKAGEPLHGIPLSHTHIEITSALDNKVYDVAIDNVFAKDYNPKQLSVPASYQKNIVAGATLYFCGGNPGSEPYTISNEQHATQGFDWVHTNCESPHSKFADGWLYTDKGVNLTNSHNYCYLWN